MLLGLSDKDTDCTCGRIAVGMTVTETRNWNPEEQQAVRAARRERLTDLWRRAREARRAAGQQRTPPGASPLAGFS